MLLYNYEGEILRYLNKCFENIKVATYASDEDLLLAISDIKHFPSFFFYREESEWVNNKILPIRQDSKVVKFCQFEQIYKGSIIVEDQKEAQKIATKLRFYWDANPQVIVPWPNKGDSLKVQLRLLYIKIREERRPNNKKGACRVVEFSWKSNLFQNPLQESEVSLVEKVNIFLTDGEVIIKDVEGKEIITNDLIKEVNG